MLIQKKKQNPQRIFKRRLLTDFQPLDSGLYPQNRTKPFCSHKNYIITKQKKTNKL